MGGIAEKHRAFRMGREGLRKVVEAGAVDADMARLAAVHPLHLLVEVVAVEVLEHHLLDAGNLVEGELREALRAHRDGGVVHLPLPLPLVAFQRVKLVVYLPDAALDLLDLRLDVGALLARGFQGRLERALLGLQLLDVPAVRARVLSQLDRVVELVPGLVQLALDELDLLIRVEVLDLDPLLELLELREPRALLAALEALHLGGALLHQLRVLRVRIQALLLLGQRRRGALVVRLDELRLMHLPHPPGDVVVKHRPQGHHDQKDGANEKDRPVGFFFFVRIYAANRLFRRRLFILPYSTEPSLVVKPPCFPACAPARTPPRR